MKLFNYYSNNIDKTWYKSSNIKYSECEDTDGSLKKLKVVYNSGAQYLYENVDVFDYINFREAQSQGKALNKWLKEKKLPYTKLENVNLEDLDDEYITRSGNGVFVVNKGSFKVYNNVDVVLYEKDTEVNEDTFNIIIDVLKSLGYIVKIK